MAKLKFCEFYKSLAKNNMITYKIDEIKKCLRLFNTKVAFAIKNAKIEWFTIYQSNVNRRTKKILKEAII